MRESRRHLDRHAHVKIDFQPPFERNVFTHHARQRSREEGKAEAVGSAIVRDEYSLEAAESRVESLVALMLIEPAPIVTRTARNIENVVRRASKRALVPFHVNDRELVDIAAQADVRHRRSGRRMSWSPFASPRLEARDQVFRSASGELPRPSFRVRDAARCRRQRRRGDSCRWRPDVAGASFVFDSFDVAGD